MSSSNKQIQILVVDDNEVDRIALKRQLANTRLAIVVEEASDGREALQKFQEDLHDCILIDYNLPDMTGVEVIDAIKKLHRAPRAIIVVTGEGDECKAVEALQHGAVDYLPKQNVSDRSLERAIFNAVEKVELMRDVERQKRALETSNKELEQFAFIASHDLREPLRIISSFLQLLERKLAGSLDEQAKQYLDFAVDGANRMDQMIRGVLELSRIGGKQEELVKFDATEALEAALHDLQLVIEESGAQIDVAPLPQVVGSRVRLAELFQNLIENSIKYRGEAPPSIKITAAPVETTKLPGDYESTLPVRAGQWRFSVEDNGIGIDPEQQERIFQLFQKLHTREESAGLGIGLALSKKIVERHGGRLWLESTPGQGTTFHFTLPSSRSSIKTTTDLSEAA